MPPAARPYPSLSDHGAGLGSCSDDTPGVPTGRMNRFLRTSSIPTTRSAVSQFRLFPKPSHIILWRAYAWRWFLFKLSPPCSELASPRQFSPGKKPHAFSDTSQPESIISAPRLTGLKGPHDLQHAVRGGRPGLVHGCVLPQNPYALLQRSLLFNPPAVLVPRLCSTIRWRVAVGSAVARGGLSFGHCSVFACIPQPPLPPPIISSPGNVQL